MIPIRSRRVPWPSQFVVYHPVYDETTSPMEVKYVITEVLVDAHDFQEILKEHAQYWTK